MFLFRTAPTSSRRLPLTLLALFFCASLAPTSHAQDSATIMNNAVQTLLGTQSFASSACPASGTVDPNYAALAAHLAANGVHDNYSFLPTAPAGTTAGYVFGPASAPLYLNVSANLRHSYESLEAMALAAELPTTCSGLTQTQVNTLLTNVVNGFNDSYSYEYGSLNDETIIMGYDAEINVPLSIMNIILLVNSGPTSVASQSNPNPILISSSAVNNNLNEIAKFEHHGTSCSTNGGCVGANLDPVSASGSHCLDQPCLMFNLSGVAAAQMLLGAMQTDTSRISDALSAMAPSFLNVTSLDGFYADGSFIQHSYNAYQAGYGRQYYQMLANMVQYLQGTSYSFTSDQIVSALGWAESSFAPVMYRAHLMDDTNGRLIAGVQDGDKSDALQVLFGMAQLYTLDSSSTTFIPKFITAQVNQYNADFASAGATSVYTGGADSPDQLMRMETILNGGWAALSSSPQTFNLAGEERFVQKEPNYALSLALFSPNIESFEEAVPQNQLGYYLGTGTTYLYNADADQYDDSYWLTTDFTRLPGTTVDATQLKPPTQSYAKYLNTDNWVGGSSVGDATLSSTQLFSSVGMQFTMKPVTGSSLEGYKSWFLLGNKMVALGAGITGGTGQVETIAENRKLAFTSGSTSTVSNSFYVNNSTPQSNTVATSATSQSGVHWASLVQTGTPAWSIGYYFAKAPALNTWLSANAATDDDAAAFTASTPAPAPSPYTNTTTPYQSIAFEQSASNNSYEYAVLPGYNQTTMPGYAAAPDYVTLQNTTTIQAVQDTASNVVGANFWSASGGSLNDNQGKNFLTVSAVAAPNTPKGAALSAASSVTTYETGSGSSKVINIGISDPTQVNVNTTINVAINRTATTPICPAPQRSR